MVEPVVGVAELVLKKEDVVEIGASEVVSGNFSSTLEEELETVLSEIVSEIISSVVKVVAATSDADAEGWEDDEEKEELVVVGMTCWLLEEDVGMSEVVEVADVISTTDELVVVGS